MRSRLLLVSAGLLGGCSLIAPLEGYSFDRIDGAVAQVDASQRDGGTDGGPPLDAGPDGDGGVGRPDASPDGGRDAAAPARCTELSHGCDLTIACSAPEPVEGAGSVVRIDWSVLNLSSTSGAGPFLVRIGLQRGEVFETVGESRFAALVGPLATESGATSFVTPAWVLPGETPLRCTVDPLDEVPEIDDSNNEFDVRLLATGLPDLSIPFFNSSIRPCGTFTVTFDMSNSGLTRATGFDWILSGGDPRGGGALANRSVVGLDAGETTRLTVEVTDPWDLFGVGTLRLRLDPNVDGRGMVQESDETNNYAERAVTWCG